MLDRDRHNIETAIVSNERPLKNVQFVIANTFATLSVNSVKQSPEPLIIKEIATAHMRLAMTGSKFFKGLFLQKVLWL